MTILFIFDALIVSAGVYLSYLLRFDFNIRAEFAVTLPYVITSQTVITLVCFISYKIYKRLWQYASIEDLTSIIKASFLAMIIFYVMHHLIVQYVRPELVVPRSIYIITSMITILGVGGSRFVWRVVRDSFISIKPHQRRTLIVGAGNAGTLVVKELKYSVHSEFYPVVFVDDDAQKRNTEILGVPVAGNRLDISNVVEKYAVQDIIIAMPSAPKDSIAEILNICKQTKCQVKILPGVIDFIHGKTTINMIRDVSVEDLLGREPVKVDLNEIIGYVSDKTVLITGAGGSIGSELCRQIAPFSPKQLLLLGRGENSIYEIELELKTNFPHLLIEPIIADVQDKTRLRYIFEQFKPDVVFHAAAHKHVPLMERQPLEAIKNNIFGTKNVATLSHEFGVSRFVLISTDKAVNPTNVMGTTKRVAELIVQSFSQNSQTKFVAVRFGNVLGSRGSVIPVFKRQIKAGGPVTVTHPEMVRYFMTIPEAVQLVIQAGALANGGEIFVLDMGKPVKIADLATDLVRLSGLTPGVDIKIIYTGIRPGEKLFEEIMTSDEGVSATKHNRIYVTFPTDLTNDNLDFALKKIEQIVYKDRYSVNVSEVKEILKQLVPTYSHGQVKGDQIIKVIDEARKSALELVATIDKKVEGRATKR